MIRRAVAFLLLLYVLGYALFTVLLPRPAGYEQTDAIVVLTGGAKRFERGLGLLQQGKAKRMLVSGVARTVRPVELAAEYKTDEKIFACCIDLGRESVDTRSNAEEVSRWLAKNRFRSIRLITTDWHMPRARFELSRRLPADVEVLSDAIESNPAFRQLFTEYNKYLLRRAAVLVGI
ncbi:MAG TPA: YdcF family protein [Allosphingosinicella sp.]